MRHEELKTLKESYYALMNDARKTVIDTLEKEGVEVNIDIDTEESGWRENLRIWGMEP